MSKPTRSKVIDALCHGCMGHYTDGKVDCENFSCPAYTYMPYRKGEPNLEWMKYNHKHVGKVLKEDTKRKMTDEQRKAAGERLAKARRKSK